MHTRQYRMYVSSSSVLNWENTMEINEDYEALWQEVAMSAENGDIDALYDMAIMLFITSGLDDKSALEKMIDAATYGHLGALEWLSIYYNEMGSDYNAYQYTRRAAECGDVESQVRLAYLYLTGVYENDGQDLFINIERNPELAAKWLMIATKGGHKLARKYLGMLKKNGISDYATGQKIASLIRVNSFSEPLLDSSYVYRPGIGFRNSDQKYSHEINLDDIEETGDDAKTDDELDGEVDYTSLDNSDMLEDIADPEIPKKTEPNQDEFDYTEDYEPTHTIQYSYLKECKKRFNPELVTLELVVPRKLKNTETMDFTRLKISYDGKDTDVKNIMMYTKIRLNEKQRRLLILLAAQNSISDKELRAKRIHRILSDRRWETSASILNHMFKSIFPGCSLPNKNCMINRQSGYIAPKLKIDTTKITNARDYPLCGL